MFQDWTEIEFIRCFAKQMSAGCTYLFSNVQAEAVTISVIQLFRKIMGRLLSTHVIDSPAQKVEVSGLSLPTQMQLQCQLSLTCKASYTARH